MAQRSPLAPDRFPDMPGVAGVRLGAVAAGIRRGDRPDVFLVVLDEGTAVAGVCTRSKTASAPVDWCRRCLAGGLARAIVVNAGNANAFTGRAGRNAVAETAGTVAELVGCETEQVFVASTGVIGEPLPVDRLTGALPALAGSLSGQAWEACAAAMMTTDTYPKGATRTARIGDANVVINGIAKGAGMIAPDMATMLAFIFTDAAVPAPLLQSLLGDMTVRTFNAITVDGDTSTSDTVLICATGKGAKHAAVTSAEDEQLADFRTALEDLMRDLAQQIVRDGEGASKFVTIAVTGAESDSAARRIGLSIGNSPLVKTAIAGEDANWGRIVMAVGKSGEKAERDQLGIRIGGVTVAANGGVAPGYDEAPVVAHMKGREVLIEVDVGVGTGRAEVWTCDLTHGYISINADYRS
ncbi:MAG: bifunctional glutamate N-acetyltransferase/amino-acid acetyltransferase ArgJ [Alphaproteobacteria bacterium]